MFGSGSASRNGGNASGGWQGRCIIWQFIGWARGFSMTLFTNKHGEYGDSIWFDGIWLWYDTTNKHCADIEPQLRCRATSFIMSYPVLSSPATIFVAIWTCCCFFRLGSNHKLGMPMKINSNRYLEKGILMSKPEYPGSDPHSVGGFSNMSSFCRQERSLKDELQRQLAWDPGHPGDPGTRPCVSQALLVRRVRLHHVKRSRPLKGR